MVSNHITLYPIKYKSTPYSNIKVDYLSLGQASRSRRRVLLFKL